MLFTPPTKSGHSSHSHNDSDALIKPRVQPKLAIGQPGDRYEVEADRTADSVVSKLRTNDKGTQPQPGFLSPKPFVQPRRQQVQPKEEAQSEPGKDEEIQEKSLSESITPLQMRLPEGNPSLLGNETTPIQQKCADCAEKEQQATASGEEPVQAKCDKCAAEDEKKPVQTKCADCEKKEAEATATGEGPVQTKCDKCEKEAALQQKGNDTSGSGQQIESQLSSSKGGGSAMADTTQSEMSGAFGTDFSGVRIHTDSHAVQMNKSLGSHAFTNGNDIYFNQGKYDPGSEGGKHLLAHELTHTVQQGASTKAVQQQAMPSAEQEEAVQTQIVQKQEAPAAEPEETVQEKAIQQQEAPAAEQEEVQEKTIQKQEDPSAEQEEAVQTNIIQRQAAVAEPEETVQEKVIQRQEDPIAEQEGTVQAKANGVVQLEGDPCAEETKKEEQKTDAPQEEESAASKDCKVRYIPAEQPPEGQEEPSGEEQPKDIEAKPKAPADERQKGAPPVDGGTKEAGEPQGENPFEICDKRDAAKAEKGGKGGEKSSEAKPGQETKQPAGETGKKPEKGGKKKEKKAGSLVEAVADQKKQQLPPVVPQGENSSPEIVGMRDENQAITAASIGEVRGTQGAIREIGSRPLSFAVSETTDPVVNAMATNFMKTQSEKAFGVLETGLASIQTVQDDVAQRRLTIEADIAAKRQSSKAFFRIKAAQSRMAAKKAKMALSSQYATTVQQITLKADKDKRALLQSGQKMKQQMLLKYMAQHMALSNAYSTSYNKHLQIGRIEGYKATQMASKMATEYRSASNPGATAYDQEHVRNKKKDGFWDGYLTYNRYMARADSAKETGKQYQEGMQTQAKEKADKLMCDKANQLMIAQGMSEVAIKNVQCALDDAVDAIELRKTATLGQAKAAHDEFAKNIDAALSGTLMQLKEKEAAQDLFISDFGARQIAAIENMAAGAIGGIVQGLQLAAGNLLEQLQEFAAAVEGNEAPDAASFEAEIQQSTVRFDTALQTASGGISEAVAQAGSMVQGAHTTATGIIAGIYDNGITEGTGIHDTYSTLIGGINGKRSEFFANHLQTTLQGLQEDHDTGAKRMDSVMNALTMAYSMTLEGLKGTMKDSEDSLREGMEKSIKTDLRATICSEAEKAAEEVQPWWKDVLKVLLVILVIVIVIALTIVTAGAFAAIGSAIAGFIGVGALAGTIATVLAGAVFGALSSFLITVGFNVINLAGTGKLTWEGAFKGSLDAAISGFIAGGIGGFAGPFLGLFSKGLTAMGPVARFLVTEGVEIAFDVIGSVVGDLVTTDGPIHWGDVFFNAFNARLMANGMKVAPKILKKVVPTKTNTDTGGPSTTKKTTGKTTAETTGGKNKMQPETPGGKKTGGKKTGVDETATGKKNAPETQKGSTKKTSEGQQQASKKGYPEAPEGYHWRKGANGEPTLVRNKGTKGGKLKYDPETKKFKPDTDAKTSGKKQFGDEDALEKTRTKNELSQKELDTEVNSRDARRPGKKIDLEEDGIRYNEEVELPNGHKWRKRLLDGGWCRFSKRKCYSNKKTRQNNAKESAGGLGYTKAETIEFRKKVTGRQKVNADDLVETEHLGDTSHQVPKTTMAKVINSPQVVLLSKNGNLVFYKNGVAVVTSSKDITKIKTAFGKGGSIPSRLVGEGKRFPPGSTGLPDPPVVLKKLIEENVNTPHALAKIWP